MRLDDATPQFLRTTTFRDNDKLGKRLIFTPSCVPRAISPEEPISMFVFLRRLCAPADFLGL
ncbi:hypothetical protein M378DRAFT_171477 [Amanita muscaria Koide BX008]|uniref:Uncharacterized protein n=1 Tax=Amanita muscaria (strain Koide BX008) TaxID=946122 RepID=A0A0C2WN71_AMAMK|nr:hypothetical protein M378DRAFT_171477 [Amanita muscaria Koide BX008]